MGCLFALLLFICVMGITHWVLGPWVALLLGVGLLVAMITQIKHVK